MTKPPDEFESLITRARLGDSAALSELFDRFGAYVRAAVRRRLPDRLRQEFDSLDFVQDVWASVLAMPSDRVDFHSPDALAGFLARIAHHKVIDVVRQRYGTAARDISREQPLSEEEQQSPAAADPTASQWAIAGERWGEIAKRLTPGQLTLLERLHEGYTLPEIATMLNTSLSTVNRLVRRIREVCEES